MNQIAYRHPTHVFRSNSCPAGIGGYSNEGFAWRFPINGDLKFRASNNLLKHLASIISPWVDILAGRFMRGNCLLSMTDSTTSEGWTHHTNFKEDDDGIQASIRIELARSNATRFMELGIREYSQWFAGSKNQVAGALSHDWDRTDEVLTQILFTHVPSQVPSTFKIVHLPNKISSFVTSLLQRLPVKEQYNEEHKMTTLGCGGNGKHTASPQGSEMTSSSSKSPVPSSHTSSVLLPWLCAKGDFRDQLMLPWLVKQSAVPSIKCQRSSGVTGTRTHPMTHTES